MLSCVSVDTQRDYKTKHTINAPGTLIYKGFALAHTCAERAHAHACAHVRPIQGSRARYARTLARSLRSRATMRDEVLAPEGGHVPLPPRTPPSLHAALSPRGATMRDEVLASEGGRVPLPPRAPPFHHAALSPRARGCVTMRHFAARAPQGFVALLRSQVILITDAVRHAGCTGRSITGAPAPFMPPIRGQHP